MVSVYDFPHTHFFSFGILLFIYGLLIGFGALVSALISWIWGEEASDEAATARMKMHLGTESSRMTKFKPWLKRIAFYEILIGMKSTLHKADSK